MQSPQDDSPPRRFLGYPYPQLNQAKNSGSDKLAVREILLVGEQGRRSASQRMTLDATVKSQAASCHPPSSALGGGIRVVSTAAVTPWSC